MATSRLYVGGVAVSVHQDELIGLFSRVLEGQTGEAAGARVCGVEAPPQCAECVVCAAIRFCQCGMPICVSCESSHRCPLS